jgi:hypothetical protein
MLECAQRFDDRHAHRPHRWEQAADQTDRQRPDDTLTASRTKIPVSSTAS